jgi:hypothetical protein
MVPPAGPVGVADACWLKTKPPVGKSAGDELHDRLEGRVGMIQEVDDPVADLAQIVGRDVGGHADGDARAPIDQEVGEFRRQDLGHGQAFIVVGGRN